MAARNFAPLQALGRNYKVIAGSFAPNGSSAVDAASRKGPGWSVAFTATGKFTITFTDKWNDLVAFTCGVEMSADNVDLYAQGGAYSASAKTKVVKLKTGATNTNLAADADSRVHFIAVFSNSIVVPTKG